MGRAEVRDYLHGNQHPFREDEIAYIVDNCEAKLLISSSKLGDLASNIRSRCLGLQHCFMVGDPLPGYASREETLKVRVICRLLMKNEAYKCCIIGTTGQPGSLAQASPWRSNNSNDSDGECAASQIRI